MPAHEAVDGDVWANCPALKGAIAKQELYGQDARNQNWCWFEDVAEQTVPDLIRRLTRYILWEDYDALYRHFGIPTVGGGGVSAHQVPAVAPTTVAPSARASRATPAMPSGDDSSGHLTSEFGERILFAGPGTNVRQPSQTDEVQMARRVFFSFHYSNDFWRVQQVRNIKALEGQPIYSASDWEEIKRKGKSAIEKWIDDNMRGTSCVVVLVGAETASRPWVLHEISKGWNDGKGVLGIRIDRLLDSQGRCSPVGENPLSRVKFSDSQRTLAEFAQLKAPSGPDSKSVYTAIVDNIEAWIEEAVQIRRRA